MVGVADGAGDLDLLAEYVLYCMMFLSVELRTEVRTEDVGLESRYAVGA